MKRRVIFWAIAAALSLAPATLFAQSSEVAQASPWIEILRNFGVPTTFLAFFVWYHLQRQKSHETAIKAKDDEITRINKENSVELSRVNELRVKEAQENANRLFQRDKESMNLLAEADKTLTMILEKLR